MKVLMSRYDEYWRDMVGFLRDIGVKNPLTEQNFCSYPYLHEQRRTYDYVDNHKYWDHPSFGGKQWGLPMFFLSESALAHRGRLPKWLGNSRVFGKPYTVTEMNFCYPNSYRAEGGTPVFRRRRIAGLGWNLSLRLCGRYRPDVFEGQTAVADLRHLQRYGASDSSPHREPHFFCGAMFLRQRPLIRLRSTFLRRRRLMHVFRRLRKTSFSGDEPDRFLSVTANFLTRFPKGPGRSVTWIPR